MGKNQIDITKHIYGCWLCSVPGIGNRTIEKLLALCPDEEEIYHSGEKLWRQVLTNRQMEQILEFAGRASPEKLYEKMLAQNIRFVMLQDVEYPGRLRNIPDAPYGLFVKGQLPEDDKLSVAVVGARECSEYGQFVASGLGKALGENRVQVISGMARGIDGICQMRALEAGGSSFGVLGCGVDICYPASNRDLYEKLCERGGILSTYPPGTEVRSQNFPPRNRIVSGLADVLVVVEARNKSGTLITVDMALEQGKEVYAVPGRVTDRLSDGCNRLIKQGAGVFLSPEDFLRELGRETGQEGCCGANSVTAGEKTALPANLSGEQLEICRVLELQPMTLEQIQERLPREYPWARLMHLLMSLCVEGVVSQISPGQFSLRGV